jgi:hypothetical protein
MAKFFEHSPQWMPQHSLGKRIEIDLSYLGEETEYQPYSRADAVATVKESGLFAEYDGYHDQQAMFEEEALARWPSLFGIHIDTQAEVTNAGPDTKTTYAVQREPSVFYAIRTYGYGHDKVRQVLESADPADHLSAIKREISRPGYEESDRNLHRIQLAEIATTAALEYAREKRLLAEMMQDVYPIETEVQIR